MTLLVEGFSLFNHAELQGDHGQLGFDLRLLLGLPDAPGSPSKLHVANADLGDVQSLGLDAHDGHFLPDGRTLDALHTLVSLIQVARGQIEGEVQDGVLDDLVISVDFVEVVQDGLVDQVLLLGSLGRVEVGDLQCKYVDDAGPQVVLVLVPDASFSGVEECHELPQSALLLVLPLLVALLVGLLLSL